MLSFWVLGGSSPRSGGGLPCTSGLPIRRLYNPAFVRPLQFSGNEGGCWYNVAVFPGIFGYSRFFELLRISFGRVRQHRYRLLAIVT